ncbi:MAG: response regulator [Planctomycetes bacterium]|nr:response regulator [Planctomycetota bacterium]
MPALHILIAEPDSVSALTIAQILMSNGHDVETCQDGVQAVSAAKSRQKSGSPYHVIICGYALPGMDGLTVMNDLHMGGSEIEFVLLTQSGQLTDDLAGIARRCGCTAFFDYPVPLTELNNHINSLSLNVIADQTAPYFGTDKFSKPSTAAYHTATHTKNGTDKYQCAPSEELKTNS